LSLVRLLGPRYPYGNAAFLNQVDTALHRLMDATHDHARDLFVQKPFHNLNQFLTYLYLSYIHETDSDPYEIDDAMHDTVDKYLTEIESSNESLRLCCMVTGLSPTDIGVADDRWSDKLPQDKESAKEWMMRKIEELNDLFDTAKNDDDRMLFRETRRKFLAALDALRNEED